MCSGFYTYLHRRNDTGRPFYIGKGKGRRASDRNRRSQHWQRITKKHGHTVEILAYWPTEEEAFEHEKFLIWLFRDIGEQIINMTDGGDGMSGYRHTEETKAKQSAAAIGRKKSQEAIEKMRKALTGRKLSAEAAERLRASRRGRKNSAESIEKAKATNALPETKERRSAAMKAILAKPDVKAKMLESRRRSEIFAASISWCFKPVMCVETGVVYKSSAEAARSLGLLASNIRSVCNGKAKSAGGLTFVFSANPENAAGIDA